MAATTRSHVPLAYGRGPALWPCSCGLLALVLLALAPACGPLPAGPSVAVMPPSLLVPGSLAGVRDGRGRFREIFAAVRDARGASFPDHRPAGRDDSLWTLSGEAPPSDRPVNLGKSPGNFRVVAVPGLFAECVADMALVFEDALPPLEAHGYKTGYIQTRGRFGCAHNARLVRDAVMAFPEDEGIILVTHSKGAVDSLEALARFPETAARVRALVCVSGAIAGSPLAETFPAVLTRLAGGADWSGKCPPGQGDEATRDLRRGVRLAFLADHPLPGNVRAYSLPAFAEARDISNLLVPFHRRLARTDPLNDGLVLATDAVIPGSTLLGYANADHLAVAMPFVRKHPALSVLLDRNAYPREVLLEAVVRYVEEDLAGR